MKHCSLIVIFCLIFKFTFSQDQKYAEEWIDTDIIEKIKEEGMKNSKVMEIAFHLSEMNGARLTGSKGFLKSAQWAKQQLMNWGIKRATIESWGKLGSGWDYKRCYLAMTSPYYKPIVAIPFAWTGSTAGDKDVYSDLILVKGRDTFISSDSYFNSLKSREPLPSNKSLTPYKGKLKGKIVMRVRDLQLKPFFNPLMHRFDSIELEKLANDPVSTVASLGSTHESTTLKKLPEVRQNRHEYKTYEKYRINLQVDEFINNEQPALILVTDEYSKNGRVSSYTSEIFVNKEKSKNIPAKVSISMEDYLGLQRLINSGVKVRMEANIKTEFYDSEGFNLLGEIPGTDSILKEEIVMVGAHLDCWHGSAGATDNAAGCAVMMEVMRILKKLNIQPRRTIRIALWGGEEQMYQGSENYIKKHLNDSVSRAKISAYYNLDNGTGKIRGIYLQMNEEVRPIFSKWLEPFHMMGAKTLTRKGTGGTDHIPFVIAGIPAFQFIQDQLDYSTRTHHTNLDSYDHLIEDDLKQAAVIISSFVYHTAQRERKIPRWRL